MFKIIVLLTLLPMTVFATKGGSGGIGLVCSKNGVSTVEVLDVYEARSKGLKLDQNFSGDLYEDALKLTTKIYKDEDEATSKARKIVELTQNYKSIHPDSELQFKDDAYPVFLPRGCEPKQIIYYYSNSLIWVDQKLYDQLDYPNKLALALHELLYAYDRKGGSTDSRYTRTIVGHAMSDQDPFSGMSEIRQRDDTYFCSSDEMKSFFYATKIPDRPDHWVFSFDRLNGHQVFSKKSAVFKLWPGFPYNEKSDTPTEVSTQRLQSAINPNEVMTVVSSGSGFTISWKGTDPSDEFHKLSFDCR